MSGQSQQHDDQALKVLMLDMGTKAHAASRLIATASNELKSSALRKAAAEIRKCKQFILKANREDVGEAEARNQRCFS